MKKIFLMVLFSISVNAQVTQEWAVRYNRIGNSDDRANSIAADSLGNIFIAGFSQNNIGVYAGTVIKYNPAGIQQWVQHYNSPGGESDYLFDLALDNMGNVYVTGYVYSGITTKADCITLKYNSNGVLQWSAKFNGPNLDDIGRSIAVDDNGNVYITGKSDTLALDESSLITIKYNSAGIQQWVVRYPGISGTGNSAGSIALDNAANVYITGSNAVNPGNLDLVTIKYNTNGVQQWAERYNGTGNSFDIPKCMVLDSSGNVFITGESSGIMSSDCLTIKYNSAGAQQWVARFNGTANNNDGGMSIALDNAGNIFVAGSSIVSGPEDILIIKYSPSGSQLWVNTFGGSGNGYDQGNSIAIDNSGSAYLTGYVRSVTELNDVMTLKYNSGGILQWAKNYNGGFDGNDYGNAIVLDPSNNVIITGYSAATNTTFDIVTIKHSQLVGVTTIKSEIPEAFSLSQNYPNPFNPVTTINFSIPMNQNVKLSLYDILGNKVSTFVNENLNAGSYNTEIDASGFSSGVYFCVLESGVYKEVIKMVLTK